MHADGKSTLASVSKWNSGKVNYVTIVPLFLSISKSVSKEIFEALRADIWMVGSRDKSTHNMAQKIMAETIKINRREQNRLFFFLI